MNYSRLNMKNFIINTRMAYYYIGPPYIGLYIIMPLSNSALFQTSKPLLKLKFTRQNARECSSEYSSKQNPPSPRSNW